MFDSDRLDVIIVIVFYLVRFYIFNKKLSYKILFILNLTIRSSTLTLVILHITKIAIL